MSSQKAEDATSENTKPPGPPLADWQLPPGVDRGLWDYIRADGVMIHDMYVMQVKSPQESKYPWDYYKVVKVMKGEDAFGPVTGLCPLAPK